MELLVIVEQEFHDLMLALLVELLQFNRSNPIDLILPDSLNHFDDLILLVKLEGVHLKVLSEDFDFIVEFYILDERDEGLGNLNPDLHVDLYLFDCIEVLQVAFLVYLVLAQLNICSDVVSSNNTGRQLRNKQFYHAIILRRLQTLALYLFQQREHYLHSFLLKF